MGLPDDDGGRPATERPHNVNSSAPSVAIPRAVPRGTDAFCCAPYSLAELRLGFGCPRHTRGPL